MSNKRNFEDDLNDLFSPKPTAFDIEPEQSPIFEVTLPPPSSNYKNQVSDEKVAERFDHMATNTLQSDELPLKELFEDAVSDQQSITKSPTKKSIADQKRKEKADALEAEQTEQQAFLDQWYAEPKQRCYIGVDNGVSGSIGIIKEDGTYALFSTPVRQELNYTKEKAMISRIIPTELAKILSIAGPGSMIVIERPMVNPTRFKATVSALRALEATMTVMETMGLAFEFIDSKAWQKMLLPAGVSGDDLKPASLDVGNRFFPAVSKHKHSDRDAMLMAEYCRRKYK